MRAYILRRLLMSVPLVFLMTFLVFAVINLNPEASIQRYIMSPTVSFQFIEQEKERLGLYDPLPLRYLRWLGGVLGDIRFGRETRALVSFADAGALRSVFDLRSSWETAVPEALLSTPGARLDVAKALAGSPWETLRENLSGLAGAWRNPGAAPARIRMTVQAATRASAGEASQDASWTAELNVPPGGTTAWSLRAVDLARRGLSLRQVSGIEFELVSGSEVKLDPVTLSGDYDVARPSRGRPYVRFPLLGPGHTVSFGRLGSPYTRMILPRGDWEPVGKVVAVEDVKGVPTEIVEKHGFKSLCLDVGNPLTVPQQAECVVISGPADHPVETVLAFTAPPNRRQMIEFPLRDLKAKGAKLDEVREFSLRATGPGVLFLSRAYLSVDKPPVSIGWVPNFGASYENNLPVIRRLGSRVKNTILLVIASMLLTWIVALPFGVIAAVRQYQISDKVLSFLSFIGMALPGFFLAILVRHIASQAADPHSILSFLPDLPTSGRTSVGHDQMSLFGQGMDILRHAILPILVLGMGGMAGLQRVMRGTMLEVQRQQFITTARAKGLSERSVIYKHALRNAITPFVAGFGSILPALIGGSALIEIVFNYPGVGQLMLPAVLNRDINLVMGNTLIAALLLVVGNLIADILLAIVDPRVSYD